MCDSDLALQSTGLVKINLLLLAKWQKVALGLFYTDWDCATWQHL